MGYVLVQRGCIDMECFYRRLRGCGTLLILEVEGNRGGAKAAMVRARQGGRWVCIWVCIWGRGTRAPAGEGHEGGRARAGAGAQGGTKRSHTPRRGC